MLSILTLVPTSTLMIAAEAGMPTEYYINAVNQGAYLISGVKIKYLK